MKEKACRDKFIFVIVPVPDRTCRVTAKPVLLNAVSVSYTLQYGYLEWSKYTRLLNYYTLYTVQN